MDGDEEAASTSSTFCSTSSKDDDDDTDSSQQHDDTGDGDTRQKPWIQASCNGVFVSELKWILGMGLR